ncbi:POL5 [Hepatospora eriocheir]|uniref:POL5 n=1 Tax=Hepatospora eriocheir TaxID=1081669 RepID=A0A1X0QCP3_9MICR|nr:POL5 [Hepatospora eriocheir]
MGSIGEGGMISGRTEITEMKKMMIEMNREKIEFPTCINNKVGPVLKIERFIDSSQQCVLEWSRKFRMIVKHCKLSDNEAIDYLYLLLDDRYHKLIEHKRRLENCLEELARESYNPSRFSMIHESLKRLKVGRNMNVLEYYLKYKELVGESDLCVPPRERFTERELTDLFVQGLPRWMAIEFIRLGYASIEEKAHILRQLESQHTYSFKDERKQSKWCDYHKSHFHSNEECKTQNDKSNKEKKEFDKRSDKSIGVITEPGTNLEEISLGCKINGYQDTKALIDTGARQTFVNENLIRGIGLETNRISRIVKVADGKEIQLTEECELKVSFDHSPNVEYKITATIFPNLTHGIILGMEFIRENNVILDLGSGLIKIDNKYFEIPGWSFEEKESPDKIMSTDVRTISEVETRISEVIKEFKLRNPEFGLLKGFDHRIMLTNKEPIQMKYYPIPYALYDGLKEELAELERNKVIRKSNSHYGLPSFVIKKPNGKVRLITNFIKLNDITVKEVYPFPDMNDLLLGLEKAEYFSQIDLDRGFYQIEIAEEDRFKTGFVLP